MKAQLAPSHGLCRPYFCVQITVLVPYEEAKTVSLNISFSTKIFITKFEIRETVLACTYGAQPSSFLDSKRNRKYRNFFSAIQTLYRGGTNGGVVMHKKV